jgi:hypothetical protein
MAEELPEENVITNTVSRPNTSGLPKTKNTQSNSNNKSIIKICLLSLAKLINYIMIHIGFIMLIFGYCILRCAIGPFYHLILYNCNNNLHFRQTFCNKYSNDILVSIIASVIFWGLFFSIVKI